MSQTIATVCMFLAGKVEETPRPLKDVILVSYEIIHKKDPEAVQRIKQKVYSISMIYLARMFSTSVMFFSIHPIGGVWLPYHHHSAFLICKI